MLKLRLFDGNDDLVDTMEIHACEWLKGFARETWCFDCNDYSDRCDTYKHSPKDPPKTVEEVIEMLGGG